MKKYIIFIIVFSLFLVGCSKTEVDVELEESNKIDELLTDNEAKDLEKENQEFQEDYLRELSNATEEEKINKDIELVEELEDVEDSKRSGKGLKFSCDMILSDSVCIEYYGSFWTLEQVELGCTDGIVSKKSCSNDSFGGCNTGEGTMADMVTWMYSRGGGGITQESVKYAQKACDSTIVSSWITRY